MTLISKKMRAFVLVARYSSISEAAKALSLTVSPVSRLISELEAFCNRKLFERRGNKIFLTPDGERLYDELGGIYSRLHDVEMELKNNGRKKNNAIYFEWGKDGYVCQINEFYLKAKKATEYEFIKMTVNNTLSDSAGVYFTSEFTDSDYHIAYNVKEVDTLCLFHNRSFDFGDDEKKLILHKEQAGYNFIRSNMDYLREKYGFHRVVTVNNELISCEMIQNGYGFGLVTKSNFKITVWKLMDVVVHETSVRIPFYVMVPKGNTHKKVVENLRMMMAGTTLILKTPGGEQLDEIDDLNAMEMK